MGTCKACGKKTIYLVKDKTTHDANCEDCFMTKKLEAKKVKKESASERLSNMLLEGGGKWFVTIQKPNEDAIEKFHLQFKDGVVSGAFKVLQAFLKDQNLELEIKKKTKPE